MRLSEIKTALHNLDQVRFVLPDGNLVPIHFHITEIGAITRHFIDCGGTERIEKIINFQLWEANDFDHRLVPQKLLQIISLSEEKLHLDDLEVEVEYQAGTIGKYALSFDGESFRLLNTQTACLAEDKCGIPQEKPKIKMSDFTSGEGTSCTPGGNCS